MGNACTLSPRKFSSPSLLSSGKSGSKNSLDLELDAIYRYEQQQLNLLQNDQNLNNALNNIPINNSNGGQQLPNMSPQDIQRLRLQQMKSTPLRTRASLVFSKVSMALSNSTNSQGGGGGGGGGSKNETDVVSINEENIDRHVNGGQDPRLPFKTGGTAGTSNTTTSSSQQELIIPPKNMIDDRVVFSDDYDFHVSCVAISEDGIMGVVGCSDYQGVCTNLITNESYVLRGHVEGVTACAIRGSTKGQVLTGSRDGSIRFYDLSTKELMWTFNLKAPVQVLMFSHGCGATSLSGEGEDRILASDCTRVVACWSLEHPQDKPVMFMDKSVALSVPDGKENEKDPLTSLCRASPLVIQHWNFQTKVMIYVRRQNRLLIFDLTKRNLTQSALTLPHVPRGIYVLPIPENIRKNICDASYFDNIVTVSENGMELYFSFVSGLENGGHLPATNLTTSTSSLPNKRIEKRIIAPFPITCIKRWGGKKRHFTSTVAITGRSSISTFVYDEAVAEMIWCTNLQISHVNSIVISDDGRYLIVGHGSSIYSKFDLFAKERASVLIVTALFLVSNGKLAKRILSLLVPVDM
jgi:WD40 repeat protein